MKAATLAGIITLLLLIWTAGPATAWDNRCQEPHYGQGVHGHYRGHAHERHKTHGRGYYTHRGNHGGHFYKHRRWNRCRVRPKKVVTHHHYHQGPVHEHYHYHGESRSRSGYFFATQLFEPGWGLVFATRGRW